MIHSTSPACAPDTFGNNAKYSTLKYQVQHETAASLQLEDRISSGDGVWVRLRSKTGDILSEQSLPTVSAISNIAWTSGRLVIEYTDAQGIAHTQDLNIAEFLSTGGLTTLSVGSDNQLLSPQASAFGGYNVAGLRGFLIQNIQPLNGTWQDDTKANPALITLEEQSQYTAQTLWQSIKDKPISMRGGYNGSDVGLVEQVEQKDSKLVLTVSDWPTYTDDGQVFVRGLTEAGSVVNGACVWFFDAPKVGCRSLQDYQHAQGMETKAQGLAAHAEGWHTTAGGRYAHAQGNNTRAGYNAHAQGAGTKALGQKSHAQGTDTQALQIDAHAQGRETAATGHYSHAEGFSTMASAAGSHTEGKETAASGDYSHAEGYKTKASGAAAHAEGSRHEDFQTVASGSAAHAQGQGTTADGAGSHSEGRHTAASGDTSHAEGLTTTALANASHAEGFLTQAAYQASHAEGYKSKAFGYSAHAEGYDTTAGGNADGTEGGDSGNAAHAEGYGTTASAKASHAEGDSTIARGNYSHAEGYYSEARGEESHAEGSGTIALGNASHAEGSTYTDPQTGVKYISTAQGKAAHAEGQGTTAFGEGSHAEGRKSTANGALSHAEGNGTVTTSEAAHAEGLITQAKNTAAHAEGQNTQATGQFSHAEGTGSRATNTAAHAEGSWTNANGVASHAQGSSTYANGKNSHAEGNGTFATGDDQHVQGRYNATDSNKAHIVGNGTSGSDRKNIHTLDWDGSAWYAGDIRIGGTSYANGTPLATTQQVDDGLNTKVSKFDSSDLESGSDLYVYTQNKSNVILKRKSTGENIVNYIPMYRTTSYEAGDTDGKATIPVTMPKKPYHAANKKFVEEYVSDYVEEAVGKKVNKISYDVEVLKQASFGTLYISETIDSTDNPVVVPEGAMLAASIGKIGPGIKYDIVNEAILDASSVQPRPTALEIIDAESCIFKIPSGEYTAGSVTSVEANLSTAILEGETCFFEAKIVSGTYETSDGSKLKIADGEKLIYVGETLEYNSGWEKTQLDFSVFTNETATLTCTDLVIKVSWGRKRKAVGVPVFSVRKNNETVYTIPEEICSLSSLLYNDDTGRFVQSKVYGVVHMTDDGELLYNYLDLDFKQYIINCGVEDGVTFKASSTAVNIQEYLTGADGEIFVSAGETIKFVGEDGSIVSDNTPNTISYTIKK